MENKFGLTILRVDENLHDLCTLKKHRPCLDLTYLVVHVHICMYMAPGYGIHKSKYKGYYCSCPLTLAQAYLSSYFSEIIKIMKYIDHAVIDLTAQFFFFSEVKTGSLVISGICIFTWVYFYI